MIDRQYVEFYCVFTTTSNDTQARFDVAFLFDGQSVSNVPNITVIGGGGTSQLNATLHERYLHGQLGKWVRLTKALSQTPVTNLLRDTSDTGLSDIAHLLCEH